MKLGPMEITWLGFAFFKPQWKRILDKDCSQKINAIKSYWDSIERDKISLKEAKDTVEAYMRKKGYM